MAYVDSSVSPLSGQLQGGAGFMSDVPPAEGPAGGGGDDGLDNTGLDDEGGDDQLYGIDDDGSDGLSIADRLKAQIDNINIARDLPDETLDRIAVDVVRLFKIDDNSRAEWETDCLRALEFASQKQTPKNFPWANASNTIYPLITTATLAFAAKMYPALIQNRSVVKGIVWGDDMGTPATQTGEPDGPPTPGASMPPSMPPPMGSPGASMTAPAALISQGGGAPAPQAPPAPDPGAAANPGMGSPPGAAPGEPAWISKPGEKRERADRIAEHMSYQLLVELPYWEPQTDEMLHQIPITGGMARKTWRDEVEARNESQTVSLLNLVWNMHAKSFESAPRHTEKLLYYPYEVREFEMAGRETEADQGMWLELNIPVGSGGDDGARYGADEAPASEESTDPDAPTMYIEQHCRVDLDEDGYAEPYVVTVHLGAQKVVRIKARYGEDDIHSIDDGDTITRIDPIEHYTLIPFLRSMDGTSYPLGFGQLLRPMNESINSALNQLFDAGTLANAGGGFVGDGLGIPSGEVRFQIGRYVRVQTKGQAIKDNILPIPFPGPNEALLKLALWLVEEAKGVAGIQDILSGDASLANASPTTILALIEQGQKVYTGIQKRIYRAFASEYSKLYELNKRFLKEPQEFPMGDEMREISPHDYQLGGGVEPIADPTMTTDAQKLGRANLLMTFKDDARVNGTEIIRRVFEAASIDRIDDLMQPPDPAIQQATMQKIQLELQNLQADISRKRAAEQKDETQAFLNLALARAKATAQEETFIASQLTFLRLSIEAKNTVLKAADIDNRASHNRNTLAHHQREAQASHDLSRAQIAADPDLNTSAMQRFAPAADMAPDPSSFPAGPDPTAANVAAPIKDTPGGPMGPAPAIGGGQ